MKGFARTLIALLISAALFAAMAVPALADHENEQATSTGRDAAATGESTAEAQTGGDADELIDTVTEILDGSH